MPSYTRAQLYNGTTASVDLTTAGGALTFTLVNTKTSTAYFNIESRQTQNVIDNATIGSLSNCSVVSGSRNAGFIVDSKATATFTFTPTSNIAKENIKFIAANDHVFSINDPDASGSFFGVNLSY
jgi:hypothetical protein